MALIYAGHTCPSFNLPQIARKRDKLIEQVRVFRNEIVTPEILDQLVNIVCHSIVGIQHSIVKTSLMHLQGVTFTDAVIKTNMWRISGNVPALRNDRPAVPWLVQHVLEWMPIQIHGAETEDTNGSATVWLQIVAGSACPLIIAETWSRGRISYVSRLLGATSNFGKLPIIAAENLTNLQFVACFTPPCSLVRPGYAGKSLSCSRSMRSRNTRLLKARSRLWTSCQHDLQIHCTDCGATSQQCSRSTKRPSVDS